LQGGVEFGADGGNGDVDDGAVDDDDGKAKAEQQQG